jgi:hypothetical protein
MLIKTHYTTDLSLLQEASNNLPNNDFRTTLNKPNGSFFYDPWIIKDEYKNTVWDKLLSTLKEPYGEARVIILEPTKCYQAHADIDDRYHLNIAGEDSYLIDLDSNKTHKLTTDGFWYDMDAGRLHTASNFGRYPRIQLVVRKLLLGSSIINSTKIKMLSNIPSLDDSRFIFDHTISKWLNYANKKGVLNNFTHTSASVEFDLATDMIKELEDRAGNDFTVHY